MADPARDALARQVQEYPKEALGYFNGGFSAASKISEDARRAVLQSLIDNFKLGRRRVRGNVLSGIKSFEGIAPRDADQLTSVYTLVIGLLSETTATAEDFVEAARGILFAPENEESARNIAASICDSREEISAAVERAQLSGAVLPALQKLNLEVDVRVRVVDGKIKTSVPVVVAHIDTDAADRQFWLQLSRGDLEDVIKQLSKALDDLKIAEALQVPIP